MENNKIFHLDALSVFVKDKRARGRKIVLCHGTFDLMHAGHIRHLQHAKTLGDVLIVTITANSFVNKGPGRPVFDERIRAESIAALECVDYVAINFAETSENVIQMFQPNIYVKGGEYQNAADDLTGKIQCEIDTVRRYGGEVFFTHDLTFSSSSLLNEHFGVFPETTRCYLRDFSNRFKNTNLVGSLRDKRPVSACVVGDAIIDEYHFTTPLGQVGKGNVLAVKYESEELFPGGAVAVANHLAGFVDKVTLVTMLGCDEESESFLRARLKPNVTPHFFFRANSPTLRKRRYVDPDMAKLFEVYFHNEQPLPSDVEREVSDWMARQLAQFDIVITPDYGNGFITPNLARAISEHSPLLAVNTQINSGNRGHHVVTRYPKADFVVLNEPELRLATHDKHATIEVLAKRIADKLCARVIMITRGSKGAMVIEMASGNITEIPALSSRVVDRTGAGDALLALASIYLADGFSPEVAGFVGSCAAALEIQIVCNRDPIDPLALVKYASTLLK